MNPMNTTETHLPQSLVFLRTMAVGLAVVGLGIGAATGIISDGWKGFMEAYIYGWVLCFGLCMGSIGLLCIHHMTGGAWSFVAQRIFEAATRVLWVMAVLFIPIGIGPLTGIGNVYSWADSAAQQTEIVLNKQIYLEPTFWTLRAVAYFAIWLTLTHFLNSWSKKMDETGDGLIVLKFRRFAPPALMTYCVTMTFAACDWVMSLEPEWFSTIYGPLFWISQGLSVLAFSIVMLSFLDQEKPMSRVVTRDSYHHLASLMLAFTVIWAYMSFSQYLITWSGNLPEEILYYRVRRGGGMTAIALILMAFHFLVPLLVLIHRRFKYSIRWLRRGCYWMLGMRLIDVFWFVNPAFHHDAPGIYWNEVLACLATVIGLAGIWLWFFLGQLQSRPLLPLNDPRLYEAIPHLRHREVPEHA